MEAASLSLSEKRKLESKPVCKYGSGCYRKNLLHFQQYSHNEQSCKKQKIDTSYQQSVSENVESCPNNGFVFTTVQGIDQCYNNKSMAVGIKDILLENADNLLQSVQFNYMFDIPWLISSYPTQSRCKPLLIVHGHTGADNANLHASVKSYSNITLCQAKLPIVYGTHHSKMMFLLYTNGLRIVIHTSNLIEKDWFQKTQGVWLSPVFQKCGTNDTPDTPDLFKSEMKEYLSAYQNKQLSSWVDIIDEYDMRNANVRLICSVPGRYTGSSINQWGHMKLRKSLRHCGPSKNEIVQFDWTIVGQFSSIGSLGDDSNKWLTSEWLKSLSTCKSTATLQKSDNKFKLKLIYPTISNVRSSLEGYSAGGSLPYSVKMAMKQRYLKEYLCQWISDSCGRSLASPHIKSYTCVSPTSKEMAWFLLTSANLSKAAWGAFEKNQSQFMIRSYEIGVLFAPEYSNCDSFTIDQTEVLKTKEYFRLPYDFPVTPYCSTDKPWVWDIRYSKEDSHGRLWIPT